MEPIFTLQYGEYAVAEALRKKLKGVSVFVPTSAQEKGIDLMLYKFIEGKNRVVAVQVKMSRAYEGRKKRYSLWFNRFNAQDNADWFVLVGIYGTYSQNLKKMKNKTKWETIMLAFKNKEMKNFLSNIRQKKDTSRHDKMFNIEFDDKKEAILTRGSVKPKNLSKFLVENRVDEIIKSF